jgi:hypothetical protein
LTERGIDPEVVPVIQAFAQRAAERGARVLLSYTSTLRSYYEDHQATLEEVHRRLSAAKPLVVLGPPSDYVFDDPHMFDTVYHLNESGRDVRTQRLVEQIRPYLDRANE